MKLRIKGNSIRLRLTKTEVQEFAEKGLVEEQISFGLTVMNYCLKAGNIAQIHAEYTNHTISVIVPLAMAQTWASTEQVGMEHTAILGEDQILRILIEKDFACLVIRSHEDDSDAFENPLKGGKC